MNFLIRFDVDIIWENGLWSGSTHHWHSHHRHSSRRPHLNFALKIILQFIHTLPGHLRFYDNGLLLLAAFLTDLFILFKGGNDELAGSRLGWGSNTIRIALLAGPVLPHVLQLAEVA